MNKAILLVDDDQRLRDLLKDYLTEKNFKVFPSQDFSEAKEILNFFIFDLIILDRMMPSGDGIDLVKKIKEVSNTPVIMLTAMGENNNRIDGLKTGADDYITKPFEPEELYLRIDKLLRLYDGINKSELRIGFGEFIFDTKTNSLKLNNKEIYLTEGENNLLAKLINNRNNILSREELADKEFDESELRKIDVGITRLRQKIEKIPKQPQFIKTIRSKGYMLICKEI
ncbi:MAG: response regulator transcription factor [Pelagibacteraceae bacterium]|jgi:two-component system phosphate regulon response regulator OmpR|nr:response regulator transcription factor [Pelagibacteraceae bacterium]MBT4645854.1 response regulator transcription factor [Pelagibacteraceae bacterium]MBT4950321.1 response regulator transcription factor [Pelagibacteraceae bacterium]MBT5213707.1 response regulator transcription factor [Pelagibacteraceae bacterium]